MLNAIYEVHKNNLIHCDIKPMNYLLFYDENIDDIDYSVDSFDPNTILKLTDFGLAHIIPNFCDKAYMKYSSGTYAYKAPEIKDVINYYIELCY